MLFVGKVASGAGCIFLMLFIMSQARLGVNTKRSQIDQVHPSKPSSIERFLPSQDQRSQTVSPKYRLLVGQDPVSELPTHRVCAALSGPSHGAFRSK